MRAYSVIISLFLLYGFPSSSAVIHVPADQSTIQAGIDAAVDGDTVIVANGAYAGEGNRNLDFGGRAITLRSANGPATCIIDCQGDGAEIRRAFYFHSGEDETAVVQGFTIRNGWAPAGPEWIYIAGGAFHCDGGSPTISGNVITDCRAYWVGGAIYVTNSSARITGNTIQGNQAVKGGAIACRAGAIPEISGNTITANTADEIGAGVYAEYGSARPEILNNTISGNIGDGIGLDRSAAPLISGNTISGNSDHGIQRNLGESAETVISGNRITANGKGALWLCSDTLTVTGNWISGHDSTDPYGTVIDFSSMGPVSEFSNNVISGNTFSSTMHIFASDPVIRNNLFHDNHTRGGDGGAISVSFFDADPLIDNCTFIGNSSPYSGGALAVYSYAHPTVTNCIFWGNDAPTGKEIYIGEQQYPADLTISYCDIEGGQASVHVEDLGVLHWGAGMIDADPLFVTGPWGDHYLSQVAAGQPEESPCVDAGDPAAESPGGTTRTDGGADGGIVDLGHHHPVEMPVMIVAGLGPLYGNPPDVRVFPVVAGADHMTEFAAYGVPHYGVNVACGDITGSGAEIILTGAGPGALFGPHVRGFRVDGTPLEGLSFLAYGTNKFGVNVAAGDLDGDGYDEIVTGAGPGEVFGPHVRAFDYDGTPGVAPLPGVSYFAYGTPKWGVNVSTGDIDGDGYDEIVTGAGPGAVYGPHVRGWNVDGGTATPIPGVSFFAFGTLKYGVNVCCGDVDGDGLDEIVTAPGPSQAFGTHIRGWNYDGSMINELPGLNFFAWPAGEVRYGARIWAGTDLDLDGRTEIIVGSGPGSGNGSTVKVFDYQAGQVALDFSLEAFPPVYTSGVNVAAGQF